jgi:hypothetical protein
MASSTFEIANALERLQLVLPMPRDFDLDEKTMREYQRAMVTFDPDIINETIDRILDGRFERKVHRFPFVSELCLLIRKVVTERADQIAKERRQQEVEVRKVEEERRHVSIEQMQRDAEAQVYMMRLQAWRDKGYRPREIAALMRERAIETRRPVPAAALALEALADGTIRPGEAMRWVRNGTRGPD